MSNTNLLAGGVSVVGIVLLFISLYSLFSFGSFGSNNVVPDVGSHLPKIVGSILIVIAGALHMNFIKQKWSTKNSLVISVILLIIGVILLFMPTYAVIYG